MVLVGNGASYNEDSSVTKCFLIKLVNLKSRLNNNRFCKYTRPSCWDGSMKLHLKTKDNLFKITLARTGLPILLISWFPANVQIVLLWLLPSHDIE